MEARQIIVAAKIEALETVLIHVAKIVFLAQGMSEEAFQHLRQNAREKLEGIGGLPGFDPSLSDHMSDELAKAVDDLIARIGEAVSNARSELRREFGIE